MSRFKSYPNTEVQMFSSLLIVVFFNYSFIYFKRLRVDISDLLGGNYFDSHTGIYSSSNSHGGGAKADFFMLTHFLRGRKFDP